MVPDLQPMLCDRGVPRTLDGWVAEPKLDGWRALVVIDDGQVTVRSRHGRPIQVPGLAALAGIGRRVVLDGELVAGAGRASDFYAVMPAIGIRRPGTAPLSFWAFDILWLDGQLLTPLPYWERRAALLEFHIPAPCGIVPSFPGEDTQELLTACIGLDIEGVVLKRTRSIYRCGERSRNWRKIKNPQWAETHAQRRHTPLP